MAIIARVLSFIRTQRHGAKVSDVKCDIGGGNPVQAEHFAAPGDDSCPLPGDYSVVVDVPRSGGVVTVGYLDPKAQQQAGPGERRLYARDAAGASVVQLWLHSDGSAQLVNAAGGLNLGADGTVTINGVTITPAGLMTIPVDLKIGPLSISVLLHGHISSAPGVRTAAGMIP